ncbi:Electron transport complex protein RnfD [Pseudoalteromonas luteoviolacea B = ATCC 29581]|nr:Electron transport complex protein RnfD [Pseudoalteromonas luteoviolacea B = ATCC 29581]
MMLTMASSPHNHSHKTVSRVMLTVIAACIPGLIAQVVFFGFGVIVQLTLALITVTAAEAAMLKMRNKPVLPVLKDGSAWLTGVLLALSIPPLAPWWIIVIGCAFAIILVKQLYGGLGYNLFNPAMAGYVLLLISFPVQMTAWSPVVSISANDMNLLETICLVLFEQTSSGLSLESARVTIDGITMATPLDSIKQAVAQGLTVNEAMQSPVFGEHSGLGWAWINGAFLLGGLVLLQQRIINWHIPVALLSVLGLASAIGYVFAPGQEAGTIIHLFSGATMLGAFFIATDPVSASTTNRGRLIFGASIGLLTYLIRAHGGYPDAMAFSVLIMNMAVPLIDHYTQPRVYGHGGQA